MNDNSSPKSDYLEHTTAGTEWDPSKRKYIAKINGRYIYTPEQLRALGSRAGKAVKGLGIRAKNDVAAARNIASRVRSNPSAARSAVRQNLGYAKQSTSNAVKSRSSQIRGKVKSGYDRVKELSLNTGKRISKSATGGRIRAKNDVAAAKKKVSRAGSRAINAWNNIRKRAKTNATNARNFVSKSATGAVIRAKNNAAAVKNKAKRAKKKATNAVTSRIRGAWDNFKSGYSNSKNSSSNSSTNNRPRTHERNINGTGTVKRTGSGLNLGGPVGGKKRKKNGR